MVCWSICWCVGDFILVCWRFMLLYPSLMLTCFLNNIRALVVNAFVLLFCTTFAISLLGPGRRIASVTRWASCMLTPRLLIFQISCFILSRPPPQLRRFLSDFCVYLWQESIRNLLGSSFVFGEGQLLYQIGFVCTFDLETSFVLKENLQYVILIVCIYMFRLFLISLWFISILL